jgi:DNA-binding transcriptional MerR regulator
MPRYLRTSDIARTVGAHPNTVRLYEEWGYLPPIPRGPNGYRRYTEAHREQMKLAWLALHTNSWVAAKRILADLVRQAAAGDLGGALELAYHYLGSIRAERTHAEAAVDFLERWSQGQPTEPADRTPLRIGAVVRLLGLTHDTLRNWERNGLITVPRNPANSYRLYGPPEIARLRVIRMLRQAGYSLMAILRLIHALDAGQTSDLRTVLDTPDPQEDILSIADRWLTSLAEYEARGQTIIAQLEAMIAGQSSS